MASRAIAIDSTYSAPYQLLGDWFARDDFYALSQDNTTAAAYYTHYLSLEPDDVDAVTKLGAVLLRMEDQQAIERQILPFMKRHPEALDLLPVAAQWAYRAEDYERASVYWNQFLERIDAQTLALHVDPTPILSDAQRAIYNALSDVEKQDFIDRFWMQKDLDPTTEVNERLQEHYQRVWMARQYFAGSAYPWDRRGEVYLRYGEPDYRSQVWACARGDECCGAAGERRVVRTVVHASTRWRARGHGVSRAEFACDVCRFVWTDGEERIRDFSHDGRWLFAGYLCGR